MKDGNVGQRDSVITYEQVARRHGVHCRFVPAAYNDMGVLIRRGRHLISDGRLRNGRGATVCGSTKGLAVAEWRKQWEVVENRRIPTAFGDVPSVNMRPLRSIH